MSDLLRDAPVGQLIRWVTKRKILRYPEEIPDFDCPDIFTVGGKPASRETTLGGAQPNADVERYIGEPLPILTRVATVEDPASPLNEDNGDSLKRTLSEIVSRPEMSKVNTRKDLEQAYINATQEQSLRQQPSQPTIPTRLVDGTILVDWYATDDAENPQNWSSKKKLLVVMQIYVYTFAVYMGSAIL
jgi:DHA1 family multidrug resistance protein-like MFS transporter